MGFREDLIWQWHIIKKLSDSGTGLNIAFNKVDITQESLSVSPHIWVLNKPLVIIVIGNVNIETGMLQYSTLILIGQR